MKVLKSGLMNSKGNKMMKIAIFILWLIAGLFVLFSKNVTELEYELCWFVVMMYVLHDVITSFM